MRDVTRVLAVCGLGLLLLSTAGCTLAPADTPAEQARLDQAGQPYCRPFEQRALPELPAQPSWQDVLQRALLANGDLEAAYYEWQAAMARVTIAGAYPNTNAALGYQYLFSRERIKTFDRGTIIGGSDPSLNTSLPMKVAQAAKVALEEAKAKGLRFQATKFTLQQKVLTAYYDYALSAEKTRIQQETVDLLKMLMDVSSQRFRAGGAQQDVLKAQTEYEMAQNELANMRVEQAAMRAMLNGMMARAPECPIGPPERLPEARPLRCEDAQLLAAAMVRNPELAALAAEARARAQAVELARLAYLPEFFGQMSIRGSIEQSLLAMVMIPINIPSIEAGIDEATAMQRQAIAMLRQTGFDRTSQFAAALYAVRNSERQTALFQNDIMPRARQSLEVSLKAYSAGTIGFADLIDTHRVLLQTRQFIAESRMSREKRLAELEALMGADLEALDLPAAPTTTAPVSQPAGTNE